jgi:hypothetical protein
MWSGMRPALVPNPTRSAKKRSASAPAGSAAAAARIAAKSKLPARS